MGGMASCSPQKGEVITGLEELRLERREYGGKVKSETRLSESLRKSSVVPHRRKYYRRGKDWGSKATRTVKKLEGKKRETGERPLLY